MSLRDHDTNDVYNIVDDSYDKIEEIESALEQLNKKFDEISSDVNYNYEKLERVEKMLRQLITKLDA